MLRLILALLIAANGLFLAWSQGWLAGLGWSPDRGERSPERMAQQTHADRIRILDPAAAQAILAPVCLQLGPLAGDEALHAAEKQLESAGITRAQWRVDSSEGTNGVWAVATIRLGTRDFQQRKEETYRKMKIPFEPLKGPPEELPTLVLSRHPTQAAAQAALDAFSQRALKGLRVIPLQAPQKQYLLRIPKADGPLQALLHGLKPAGAEAHGFKPCPAAATGAPQDASNGGSPPSASSSTAASARR